MHYSIQVQRHQDTRLTITGRKPSQKHRLICVESGLVLCRLGKTEYAIEAGQSFWLPFDCLSSWTIFPDSHYSDVEISPRVKSNWAKDSGYIEMSTWLKLIIDKMTHTEPSAPVYPHLSYVLRDALCELVPAQVQSSLTKDISSWSPATSPLSHDIQRVLLAREAKKMMQSGKKNHVIIEQLFAGDETHYEQLKKDYSL